MTDLVANPAPLAPNHQEERLFGLVPAEEQFAKSLAAKALLCSLAQPLSVSKVLIQLGHEPFPLSTGQTLIFAGRNAYFLPNVFSYIRQLADTQGISVLWTGLDSALAAIITQGFAQYQTEKYINEFYPNIGGAPEYIDKEDHDLTDHQAFKRALRSAIRESVVRTVAVTASRPFAVVMIRQVAQLIGKEAKYTTTFKSLNLIGIQEGPGGLFSGLAPQILGEIVVIFGIHALTYGIQRMLIRVEAGDPQSPDKNVAKAAKDLHGFIKTAVPFVVNSFGYPYGVVSTVMAVAGSGLAVSFLPYSPSFVSWHNAWDYLYPSGLKRGARMFLREQVGAVTVGSDSQLYASNSYFA